MTKSTSKRLSIVFVIAVALLAAAAILVNAMIPKPVRFATREGHPLLEQGGKQFHDADTGLRFVPPAEWGMQVRSTEGPQHRAERMIVKFKRLVPNKSPAWLRVRVYDRPGSITALEYLAKRKPSEADWKPLGAAVDGLTCGGLPAARRVWAGPYQTGDHGEKAYQSEVTVVVVKDRLFEFAGTFDPAQPEDRDQLHAVLASVAIDVN